VAAVAAMVGGLTHAVGECIFSDGRKVDGSHMFLLRALRAVPGTLVGLSCALDGPDFCCHGFCSTLQCVALPANANSSLLLELESSSPLKLDLEPRSCAFPPNLSACGASRPMEKLQVSAREKYAP
jgi:hypothetical protein